MKKPVMLMILDGFGHSEEGEGNGVAAARKPHFDRLWAENCHGYLSASGESVGLPAGQMGNSEVGHLNMGAGRVVYQELTRISRDIENGDFFENPVLLAAFKRAKSRGGRVHLMGLLSDGGIHSDIRHLIALLQMAGELAVDNVFIHCFLDGRDVLPTSARQFLDQISAAAAVHTGRIATIMGRYYAMDRDKRYDRLAVAWRALVNGEGNYSDDYGAAIDASYAAGVTDEFVKPIIMTAGGAPVATVEDGDSIIFYNFRTDRARELLWAFKDPAFDGFDRGFVPAVDYTLFTLPDARFDLPVAFPQQTFVNNLGQYLAKLGKTQLRIAETEKYAHVTFFFNGQAETPNEGEERRLIPSPQAASYDEVPRMSAGKVTEAVLSALEEDRYDFIVLNYANPDMVGHTGNFEAVVEAIEYVDDCLGRVVAAVRAKGGAVLLTADHGNAEKMSDGRGGPYTAHTTNPVPYIVIGDGDYRGRDDGILADIAPTLLRLLGLPQPAEMTGTPLIS